MMIMPPYKQSNTIPVIISHHILLESLLKKGSIIANDYINNIISLNGKFIFPIPFQDSIVIDYEMHRTIKDIINEISK